MSFLSKIENLRSALMEAPFLWRLVAALIFGVGLSFIQAPYDLWFLLFSCFGAFYFLYASAANKKQAFFLTYAFAFGYFVAGLNWIGNALLVDGNAYRWAWPLAVVGLPLLLSFFTALYATIAHIVFKKNTLRGFIGFTVLLLVSEWGRGYAFTGFPWNLYGYGWSSQLPIMQSLSLFGPYGLTFLTIFWGCSVGYLLTQSSHKIAVAVICVVSIALVALYGVSRLDHSYNAGIKNLSMHIVQPNILQVEKWQPRKLADNFQKHVALSSGVPKALRNIYIWPETALPPSFLNSLAVQERLKSLLTGHDVLLSGALISTPHEQTETISYHNALMKFDGLNTPQKLYAKSHLVPFGEYIPFQKYIPLSPVVAFTGFEKGNGPQTIDVGNALPTLSPLICYEVIFPHQSTDKGGARPDYILTVTNDAWYGDSAGPYQHFQQARFRAIEQGVPVVRSANTGMSGLIDPYGRVVNQMELSTQGVITAQLPQKTPEKTIYGRFGDKPFLCFMALCFGWALWRQRKDFS